jgi:hypothetical protein
VVMVKGIVELRNFPHPLAKDARRMGHPLSSSPIS